MIVRTNYNNISVDLRGFGHQTAIIFRDTILSKYWVLYKNKNYYIESRNNGRGFRVCKLTRK